MEVVRNPQPRNDGAATDSADGVWQEFRRTRVRLTLDEGTLDLAPVKGDGDDRDGLCGWFLPGATGPLHILTAQNPMGLAASDEENRAANAELAKVLGADDRLTVWPATGYGGGPIDSAATWQEAGFAVEGLSRVEALELARRFSQRAIFEWRNEPGGFRLVACDGSADEPRGWTTAIATPSSPPPPPRPVP